MLSILFYNIHGSEQEFEFEKKTKPHGSSSRYNGVCIRNVKSCSSFEASFLAFRLGNKYPLETDAALAYDSAIRARGLKEHYRKINFATENDYLQAREEEMKNRDKSTDLGLTLGIMIKSVKSFREQLASKLEKPPKQEESEPEPSYPPPRVSARASRQTFVSRESTNMLNSLFYNYHGSEKELKLKKRKPRLGTSRYMGVHQDLSKTPEPLKYEVRFNKFRLGSYFLETDAALAYDSAIRARALEEHYNKGD